MLETKSGFQAYVNKQNPNTKGIHCMIHRYALASITLPPPSGEVLDQTIRMGNFVKGGARNCDCSSNFALTWMQTITCYCFIQILGGFQEEM